MKKIKYILTFLLVFNSIIGGEKIGEIKLEIYPLIDKPLSIGAELNYYFEKSPEKREWIFLNLIGYSRNEAYYRYDDGSIYTGDEDIGKFNQMGLDTRAGIKHRWYFEKNQDKSFTIMLYGQNYIYKNDFENTNEIMRLSNYPDKKGLNQTELKLIGIYKNIEKVYEANTIKGVEAEAVLAAAPNWINKNGSFERATLILKSYGTIVNLKHFNIVLGNRVVFDKLAGEYIPIMAKKSIGGMRVKNGVGSAVRGIGNGKYDGVTKLIINNDMRMSLPGYLYKDCIPMMVVFYDIGFADDFKRELITYGIMGGVTVRPYYLEGLFGERLEILTGIGSNDDREMKLLFDIGVHF